MHTLKGYVHNNAHPEGPMAEAYIADECLTFCSRYLHRAETRFNRLDRNEDEGGSSCLLCFWSKLKVSATLKNKFS